MVGLHGAARTISSPAGGPNEPLTRRLTRKSAPKSKKPSIAWPVGSSGGFGAPSLIDPKTAPAQLDNRLAAENLGSNYHRASILVDPFDSAHDTLEWPGLDLNLSPHR